MKKIILTIAALFAATFFVLQLTQVEAIADFTSPQVRKAKIKNGRAYCPSGWTVHKNMCYKCPDTHPYFNSRQGRCNSR